MSGVFQNIDLPPPAPLLPPHQRGGEHTRRAVRGVGVQYQFFISPPLLVQRYNGTTAGQGHLEVGWNAHAQIPPQTVNL